MGIEKSLRSAASSVRKIFQDDFSRVDQAGLGKSSDGSTWKGVRGSFNISGSSAAGANSDYPIATVEMPFEDVSIEIEGIGSGASAALWVTDSGNWISVGVATDQVYGCSTCYDCIQWADGCTGAWYYVPSTCNQYNSAYGGNAYCCGGFNTCNARNSKYNYCNSWSCSRYCYNTFVPAGTNCPGGWNSSQYTCEGYIYPYCSAVGNPYSCNCSYSYPSYLRIMRSIAGTVSTLASYAISGMASSLRVKTSGTQITAQVYSGSNLTSQIDNDIVYTPSGIAIEAQYGITIMPSAAYQSLNIGSVTIKKN